MKNVALIVLAMAFSCNITGSASTPLKDSPNISAATGKVYRYDAQDGTCKDANNNVGLNLATLADLLSGDVECSSFSNLRLVVTSRMMGPACENHTPCLLDGWNFRGADLSELATSGGVACGIHFLNADFAGAKLDSNMPALYSCFDGRGDRFTVFGANINCEAERPVFQRCSDGINVHIVQ